MLSGAGRLIGLLCIGAAMACAGAAAWLLCPGDGGARRVRSLFPAGGAAPDAGRLRGLGLRELADGVVRGRGAVAQAGPGSARDPGRWTAAAARLAVRPETVCLVAAACVAALGRSLLPLLVGLAVLPPARRAARARRARRARDRRADDVIALCGALAGEVRAGRHPGEALLAAARASGGLATAQAPLMAAARFGGDVPRALAAAARDPGAEGLLGLAACWRVAVDSGAGLAAGLDRLEAALRAEQSQRADLRAQLSGPRSTAALLAVLPVFGLLLGGALGARPLHVLLHTGAGLGCLLVGGVLEGTGLWWALRIVRNGERG
ncbi:type II secretion system F family protein [Streptomyces sp. TS71-3]|uniref:type II secretion system F family protein n=1 Tax=Streptomyces sp. TS71-3 TaxID=2733862 RepID=UPI001BB3F629|nr:type II secretion system F family protein [Streptomyces sp. TS71-3]